MIRQWLRNWLGIQRLDDAVFSKSVRTASLFEYIEPQQATVITQNELLEPEPLVKKGYDAPVR